MSGGHTDDPAGGWGLVIDHAGRTARVALGRDENTLSIGATEPSRRHRVDLLDAADRLLSAAGLTPGDLAWAGWVTGPGSFTGLRVAASTVQMLRFAREAVPDRPPLRVVGVPATDALLAANPGAAVALAVKRGTAWTAAADLPAGLRDLDDVRAGGRTLLADPPHGDLPPEVDLGVLFRLARDRVSAGRCDRPEDLRPLYPREPEAVTIWAQNQAARGR